MQNYPYQSPHELRKLPPSTRARWLLIAAAACLLAAALCAVAAVLGMTAAFDAISQDATPKPSDLATLMRRSLGWGAAAMPLALAGIGLFVTGIWQRRR